MFPTLNIIKVISNFLEIDWSRQKNTFDVKKRKKSTTLSCSTAEVLRKIY